MKKILALVTAISTLCGMNIVDTGKLTQIFTEVSTSTEYSVEGKAYILENSIEVVYEQLSHVYERIKEEESNK